MEGLTRNFKQNFYTVPMDASEQGKQITNHKKEY